MAIKNDNANYAKYPLYKECQAVLQAYNSANAELQKKNSDAQKALKTINDIYAKYPRAKKFDPLSNIYQRCKSQLAKAQSAATQKTEQASK